MAQCKRLYGTGYEEMNSQHALQYMFVHNVPLDS